MHIAIYVVGHDDHGYAIGRIVHGLFNDNGDGFDSALYQINRIGIAYNVNTGERYGEVFGVVVVEDRIWPLVERITSAYAVSTRREALAFEVEGTDPPQIPPIQSGDLISAQHACGRSAKIAGDEVGALALFGVQIMKGGLSPAQAAEEISLYMRTLSPGAFEQDIILRSSLDFIGQAISDKAQSQPDQAIVLIAMEAEKRCGYFLAHTGILLLGSNVRDAGASGLQITDFEPGIYFFEELGPHTLVDEADRASESFSFAVFAKSTPATSEHLKKFGLTPKSMAECVASVCESEPSKRDGISVVREKGVDFRSWIKSISMETVSKV